MGVSMSSVKSTLALQSKAAVTARPSIENLCVRLADAMADCVTHPDCPPFLRSRLEEFETCVLNEARRVPMSPEQEARQFCAIMLTGLEAVIADDQASRREAAKRAENRSASRAGKKKAVAATENGLGRVA